jgi:HAD superfamily hydrolase (TIGR01509 family)
MALAAVLFDVDGTLVDTNPTHVEAWRRAFTSFGYAIGSDRIATQVGQGGDRMVPAILGPSTAPEQCTAIRQSAFDEFLAITENRHFPLLPGVVELFAALHARGVRTALATSSTAAQLARLIPGWPKSLSPNVVVTGDEVRDTKPAPDIVLAATTKLGLDPACCAYVGDTAFDVQAATAAGVVPLAVLTGSYSEATLRAAGAQGVWRDPAALLADLENILCGRYQP